MKETKGEVEEVRPGRKLFVRKFLLNDSSSGKESSGATSTAGGSTSSSRSTNAVSCQLFLMHGLCATERQYHAILSHLDQLLSSNKSPNTATSSVVVECILYDWMGCGQSPVIKDSWSAYENEETRADLRTLIDKYVDPTKPVIFVAHSYGPSILLPTLADLKLSNLKGLLLASTAFRSEETKDLIRDGGHPIMSLPVFILNYLQTYLSKAFCEQGVHPDHIQLKEIVIQDSDKNDMYMAKAYHRHTVWCKLQDAIQYFESTPIPRDNFVVLHGVDDGLIPARFGEIIANKLGAKWVAVQKASHLVLVEQALSVAETIHNMILYV